jgi:hypothetical protein
MCVATTCHVIRNDCLRCRWMNLPHLYVTAEPQHACMCSWIQLPCADTFYQVLRMHVAAWMLAGAAQQVDAAEGISNRMVQPGLWYHSHNSACVYCLECPCWVSSSTCWDRVMLFVPLTGTSTIPEVCSHVWCFCCGIVAIGCWQETSQAT